MFEALGNWVAFDLFNLTAEWHLGAAVQFFVMDVANIFALLIVT